MAATAAMRCKHLPDGGIQWLRVKPHRCIRMAIKIASDFPAFVVVVDLLFVHYFVVVIDVISLSECQLRPPSMMDAVSATIFDSGRVICQKHK